MNISIEVQRFSFVRRRFKADALGSKDSSTDYFYYFYKFIVACQFLKLLILAFIN